MLLQRRTKVFISGPAEDLDILPSHKMATQNAFDSMHCCTPCHSSYVVTDVRCQDMLQIKQSAAKTTRISHNILLQLTRLLRQQLYRILLAMPTTASVTASCCGCYTYSLLLTCLQCIEWLATISQVIACYSTSRCHLLCLSYVTTHVTNSFEQQMFNIHLTADCSAQLTVHRHSCYNTST